MADARVLEDHDDDGGAEQAEADGEHAGHAAGAEGHLQGGGQRARLGRGRGADVAPHGQAHADEAGQAGQDAAEQEGQGPEDARTGTKLRADWCRRGSTTLVEVKKTRTASGTRMTAMVLNWRRR